MCRKRNYIEIYWNILMLQIIFESDMEEIKKNNQ